MTWWENEQKLLPAGAFARTDMAHPVLFITSLCMFLAHLVSIFTFGAPLILQWSYLCGVSTSVWNHGTVNRFAMWSDRIMMVVGCAIDLYFILSLPLSQAVHLLSLTMIAVAAYAVGKYITGGARAISVDVKGLTWKEGNPWASTCHVVAHAFVSLSHCSMLYFIRLNDDDAETHPVARSLVLTAGVMPLLLYGLDVLDGEQSMRCMPAKIRSLWVVVNAIVWVVLIGVPCMLCLCLFPVLGRSVAERLIWHCGCVYFKIILWASAVSLEIIGLENLDAQVHYVFASNHVAWFDVPVIFSALPFWMIPVSKVSIAYIPIFGWLVRLAGTILVERDNHTKCVESMNNGFGSLRERPKSVLLFPEGRRSDDGTLQDFKRGGFMLAIQSKMPVVPIALIGTDKIAGRSFSASIRPRRVTVVVGTPVETTNMDVEDRNKLACSIYTGMFILFMYCLCRIRDGF